MSTAKHRILFLGTPDFAATALRRLIANDKFEIVGVVSQPDRPAGRKMQLRASPVKELALLSGLRVYTPESVNTEQFRQEISSLGAESAAVVAFGQILGQKFLDLFPKGSVNVHGSLLPRWRGAAPIQRALMAGDNESGVALQIVVRALDAGPILGIRKLQLNDEINALELHDELKLLGAELLELEYSDYLSGKIEPKPQDESSVTIAPKIDKAEAKIDWTKSAREIHNHIRGLAMGPFAFTTHNGQQIKIHKTSIAEEKGQIAKPGSSAEQGPTAIRVACGAGALDLLEVQPESRSRMAIKDFALGYFVNGPKNFGD